MAQSASKVLIKITKKLISLTALIQKEATRGIKGEQKMKDSINKLKEQIKTGKAKIKDQIKTGKAKIKLIKTKAKGDKKTAINKLKEKIKTVKAKIKLVKSKAKEEKKTGKRGRPRKSAEAPEVAEAPKKRGRKPKEKTTEEAPIEKKKRGRKPKISKISEEEIAAVEQEVVNEDKEIKLPDNVNWPTATNKPAETETETEAVVDQHQQFQPPAEESMDEKTDEAPKKRGRKKKDA